MDTAIDIIGIGGAGGFLASSLYRGGLPPRIISRGMALRQLQDIGLTIVSENKRTIYAPVNCAALDDVKLFAPVILLATKSYDVPTLLEEIAPRITPETLLVSVQNGFAAQDAVSNMFGADRAVMGVLYVVAHIISPGVIDIKPGITQLFLPVTHRTMLLPAVYALENAGVEAALVDDIERRMWMKQLFLVPFAIINAEVRIPIGKILEDADLRARWAKIAQEIAMIARASSIPMPADAGAASLTVAERFDPQADSSFARDVWANRPHEAEALFGPLLRRAKDHHLDCPLLQQAYQNYMK